MTPHEFQQRYDINAKRLRGYLRGRWPNHQSNDEWHLTTTMVTDAKEHFRIGAASDATSPITSAGASSSTPSHKGEQPRPTLGLHRDLHRLAVGAGLPIALGTPVTWLSGRGHLNPAVVAAAGDREIAALADIHRTLGGSAAALASKRPGNPPTPDLIHVPTGCLIEVDEIQHFTTARLRSLDLYPPTTLGFDLDEYRATTLRHKAQGDKAFAHKVSVDFPQFGGRQAQRAYNDSLRDLLAPTFTGHGVIRISAPERRIDGATLNQLRTALNQLI